jgi:hypothetical protein
MGIMARRQGDQYVITSDRMSHATPTLRAPRRMSDSYQVWTGSCWSTNIDEAMKFGSPELADEYMRANYGKVTA